MKDALQYSKATTTTTGLCPKKTGEQIEMLFAWREAFAAVDLPAFHKQTEE